MAKSKEMLVEFVTDFGLSEDSPKKGQIMNLPVDEAEKLMKLGVVKEPSVQLVEDARTKAELEEAKAYIKQLEKALKDAGLPLPK